MSSLWMFRSACAIGLLLALTAVAVCDVVPIYISNPGETGICAPNAFWHFTDEVGYSCPIGNELNLGSSFKLARFELILNSTGPVTLPSLSLWFYNNDGLDGNGADGAPRTFFWSETRTNLLVNGPTIVTYTPNVQVPADFTWITQAVSADAGIATCFAPTLGPANDFFWVFDELDQNWYRSLFYNNSPSPNLGANIYRYSAAPEPATSLLLSLGLVILCRRRVDRNRGVAA